jgi:DNA-binding transcriptional MerR regulator
MTIQELADRAEVTTRTIRYYVEQGVLSPPERGRPAEYTEEHVAQLALIKRLKEQYLPLEEIGEALQGLSPQDVERLAQLQSTPPQDEARQQKLSSAADYISDVLKRGAVREELKRKASANTEVGEEVLGNITPPEPPAFGTFVPSPVQAPAPAPGAMPAPQFAPLPVRRRGVEGVTAPASSAYIQSPAMDTAADKAAVPPAGGALRPTTWERVDLGEGVELQYQAGGSAHVMGKVARLIEVARHILGNNPENGE